jgi:predicted O-methyltransferase YrrM
MSALEAAIRRFRSVAKSIVHPAVAPLAIRRFRSQVAPCLDPERALDLADAFEIARIRIKPMQVRSEILPFLAAMASRRPQVVLEIGTANGGTLFLFTRIAAPDALLISVDLPGGAFGGGYPPWKESLYREFPRSRQSLRLLRADSHDPATVARVRQLLGGRPVDLLFIDGDHSYDGVRADHRAYAPLVRPGGVIAFHDIVPGPDADVGGVPRFWRELKSTTRVEEIVADWNQGGYGIGITIAAGTPSPPLLVPVNASDPG